MTDTSITTAPDQAAIKKRDMITLLTVVAPLLVVSIIGLCFHSFVWNAINANKAINLGIIGTASFGAFLIIRRLLEVQTDFRIIERFRHESNQGADMKVLLEEPWLKKRYVRNYLSHIANTEGTLSSQLEHSLIQSELHALQADYDSRLELPQFIVGFMIAMGLLGTFIGLLATLTGISGMLDGMGAGGASMDEQFKGLIVKLREPIGGMGIAFSASMFGLITSLMLAIMMTNLRRFIARLVALAHNVMHELTKMVRESGGGGGGNGDVSTPAAFVLGSDSSGTMAMLAGRIDVLSKRIEGLANSFIGYSDNVRRMNDLMGVGPRMKETAEKSLEAMQAIVKSQEDHQALTQSLIGINSDVVHRLEDMLNTQRQYAAHEQREAQALMDAISEVVRKLEDMLSAQRQFSAQNQRESQSLNDVTIQVSSSLSGILESHKAARNDFNLQMQTLAKQLSSIKDIDLGSAKHLNEIKELITKLCDAPGVVDLIASGVGEQTVLVTSLIEEIRRVQQGLVMIGQGLMEKRV